MNVLRSMAVIVAAAATLALAATPSSALAQAAPKATKITLASSPALDNHGHPIKGQYSLVATLTTADGRFVPNGSVQFVENVEFFGARSASLGSAVTDSTGYAAVVYQPSQKGQHTLIARFGGNSQYAASDASVALNATDVVAPFASSPLPLASVGHWLSIAMAILGLLFWTVLLGVLARAAWRIRTASNAAVSIAATGSRD